MLNWDKKYETGVQDIDEHHKSLFNYINELEECLEQGIYEGNRLEIILNFFQMYCASHFCLEETCMLVRKCAIQDKNKAAHDHFLIYYKKFRAKYKESTNKKEMLTKLHESLMIWLADHIMKIDMQLKELVA